MMLFHYIKTCLIIVNFFLSSNFLMHYYFSEVTLNYIFLAIMA